jgi:hypothetical protein
MSNQSHSGAVQGVQVPAPHDGIYLALRGAYAEPVPSLPSDIATLLEKLR